jgi:hypothetical protein
MAIKEEVLKELNKNLDINTTMLIEFEQPIDLTLKKVEELFSKWVQECRDLGVLIGGFREDKFI